MTSESAQEIVARRAEEQEGLPWGTNPIRTQLGPESDPGKESADGDPEGYGDPPVGREFTALFPVSVRTKKRFGRKKVETAAQVYFFVYLAANADAKFGYEYDLVPGTEIECLWAEDALHGGYIIRTVGRVHQVKLKKVHSASPESIHAPIFRQP